MAPGTHDSTMFGSFIETIPCRARLLHSRAPEIVLVISAVILGVVLRLNWVGHILTWDEAMSVCTVRSFAAGGGDFSSFWIWRHPPGFSMMMLLLGPFSDGFAARVQVLAVALAGCNIVLLHLLNRQWFGPVVGVLSAWFLALMPGSIFFDVWVKQDHPVTTFGLMALLFLARGRLVYTGLALGCALLCKETAVFYAGAVAILWLAGVGGRPSLKDGLAVLGVALVTCGWWYLVVLPLVRAPGPVVDGQGGIVLWARSVWMNTVSEHLAWAAQSKPDWQQPWWFYFRQGVTDLGPGGFVLGGCGAVVLVLWRLCRSGAESPTGPGRLCGGVFWPLAVLVPSYLLLSLLPNKVAWLVIVLFPAWATLQAVGVGRFVSIVFLDDGPRGARSWALRGVGVLLLGILGVQLVGQVAGRDYEKVFAHVDLGQLLCARHSRAAAELLNRHVSGEDPALVTSFYHWYGIPNDFPCAVFACYLRPGIPILQCSREIPADAVVELVKQYRLKWALVSPLPGKARDALLSGLAQQGLRPVASTRTAWLFDTRSLLSAEGSR